MGQVGIKDLIFKIILLYIVNNRKEFVLIKVVVMNKKNFTIKSY